MFLSGLTSIRLYDVSIAALYFKIKGSAVVHQLPCLHRQDLLLVRLRRM